LNRKGRKDRQGKQDSYSNPRIRTAPARAFRFRGWVIMLSVPLLASFAISAVKYFGSRLAAGSRQQSQLNRKSLTAKAPSTPRLLYEYGRLDDLAAWRFKDLERELTLY
jgi:hypothetical protein